MTKKKTPAGKAGAWVGSGQSRDAQDDALIERIKTLFGIEFIDEVVVFPVRPDPDNDFTVYMVLVPVPGDHLGLAAAAFDWPSAFATSLAIASAFETSITVTRDLTRKIVLHG